MSRIVLVSADAHASTRLSGYKPYLEEKYHDALDQEIERTQPTLDRLPMNSAVHGLDDDEADAIDDSGALRSGGARGAHDATRRLQEMDREGIVCEIVNADTTDSESFCVKPFCWPGAAPQPAELRDAGARAYNRWLADLLAETDGRVLGVAEAGSGFDIPAAVEHLEWAAEHGFVSVHTPGQVLDPDLPPLYDSKHYERFWAACADLGLVVNVHAGWGLPQIDLPSVLSDAALGGNFKSVTDGIKAAHAGKVRSHYAKELGPEKMEFSGGPSMQAREPLWQLMAGGVFDRHPSLKFAITELRSDWLPATLAALDERVAKGDTPLQMKPSEYFRRNCRVTPSFPHPAEMQMRYEIGVEQIMFGRDYPHPEGTWPNTWDWIRAAYVGVPEDEARRMLGENAIDWYGLDRAKLTALAEEIGPRPEDLLGDHEVDPRKIASFDARGGFGKPAEDVDTGAVVRAFELDLAASRA